MISSFSFLTWRKLERPSVLKCSSCCYSVSSLEIVPILKPALNSSEVKCFSLFPSLPTLGCIKCVIVEPRLCLFLFFASTVRRSTRRRTTSSCCTGATSITPAAPTSGSTVWSPNLRDWSCLTSSELGALLGRGGRGHGELSDTHSCFAKDAESHWLVLFSIYCSPSYVPPQTRF